VHALRSLKVETVTIEIDVHALNLDLPAVNATIAHMTGVVDV